MYVSDVRGCCIVVYETSGQYVTSFGRLGLNEGQFLSPFCITSCVDGIYVTMLTTEFRYSSFVLSLS